MYGEALETWAKEPLTSSGVDVWVKRTRRLVLNDWYMTDDYHRDNGEGADFYSAGPSRGCGGSGIWSDGQLRVSRNFRGSRVLAAGPIRLVFELSYEPWDIGGGRSVSERKRVTLDAGSNFNRFDSLYTVTGGAGESVLGRRHQEGGGRRRAHREGGGLDPHLGADPGRQRPSRLRRPPRSGRRGRRHRSRGERPGGGAARGEGRASYYAGSAWDRSGDFAGVAEWDRHVQDFAERARSPLQVEVRPR